MSESSSFSLDKRVFLIQILITISISVFLQLVIDPLIIDPLTKRHQNIFETAPTVLITSLSCWFFSFSMSFLYYPKNELVNSYLFCSIIPLTVIVAQEFFALFFFDLLHLIPIIVVIYIILKKRDTINPKYVTIFSPILVIWYFTVKLLGLNYLSFEIFPFGLIYMIIWAFLNVIISYILKNKIKNNLN